MPPWKRAAQKTSRFARIFARMGEYSLPSINVNPRMMRGPWNLGLREKGLHRKPRALQESLQEWVSTVCKQVANLDGLL